MQNSKNLVSIFEKDVFKEVLFFQSIDDILVLSILLFTISSIIKLFLNISSVIILLSIPHGRYFIALKGIGLLISFLDDRIYCLAQQILLFQSLFVMMFLLFKLLCCLFRYICFGWGAV